MRVVDELIRYFRSRGELNARQLEYLEQNGFLVGLEYGSSADARVDVEEPEDTSWWRQDPNPGAELELLQEEIERAEIRARARAGRATRGGRAGRGNGRGPSGDIRELLARLDRLVVEQGDELDGLLQVAGRIESGAALADAPTIVRSASSDRLDAAVFDALEARRPTLAGLWRSVRFDGHYLVVEGPGLPPATANAYRNLLATAGRAGGSYARLLRQPRVCWTVNLVQAQHDLLTSLGRTFDRRPEIVAGWIRRGADAEAYLAFVLLYGARLADPGRVIHPPAERDR